jgi:hypothetical protein
MPEMTMAIEKVGREIYIPSLASSKQCFGWQCEVKIVILWPRFCKPTAASMMRRSAPPMPRSGWMNMIFRCLCEIESDTVSVEGILSVFIDERL